MSALTEYLRRMREIQATGAATPETSYYAALENLLTAVGSALTPRILVTAQLSARSQALIPRGSAERSLPDFGFFVAETQDLRGLIEAKGVAEDVFALAQQPQITKYLRAVPAVLITNYREFLLVTRSAAGGIQLGPHYILAPTADAFWHTPIAALGAAHDTALSAYLEIVLQHAGPIASAEELAFVLARYATEAKARIDRLPGPALDPLRTAMGEALGITFIGPHGEAFFRSSLIQTVFYGLFAAWTIWAERPPPADAVFTWEEASAYLNVAVVGALFEAIATNRRLRTLNLADPVRWAEAALNRVQRDGFFAGFDQGQSIQYFYEPFLEAYDPVLRAELGVWYTPPEIVQYQVERVDQLLQTELGLDRGLADESVVLLDPCTGTGSYLLAAARVIYRRLRAEEPGIAAASAKHAITRRLFGFEIMPAPFVIAHLQISRLAAAFGSGLGDGERARVYLTNALTNWGGSGPVPQTAFPELTEEREAAEQVKREERILVVIGNPPYWRYTTMAIGEQADLIAPYKEDLYHRFGVRKTTIDDLYIRFYRLGEWRIADQPAQRGIVSFISNGSWLAGSSFPIMRERFIQHFDSIRIDSLGGGYRGRDRRLADADESVFATKTAPGISVSVAISFLVTRGPQGPASGEAQVWYRHLRGTAEAKRHALLQSLDLSTTAPPYTQLRPSLEKKWVLRPAGDDAAYRFWLSLDRLLPVHQSGINENRGGALIAIDRPPLEELRTVYLDPTKTDQVVAAHSPRADKLMGTYARYNAAAVRAALLDTEHGETLRLVRLALKPLDDRWLLWGGNKLLNEKRSEFLALVDPETVAAPARNVFLIASENARVIYHPPGVTTYLGDLHYQDPWAQFFPLRWQIPAAGFDPARIRPNLAAPVLKVLAAEWGVTPSASNEHATAEEMALVEAVFYHVLATMHTPAYRAAHEEALATNWARMPVPLAPDLLRASAQLGRRVAELLRTDLEPWGVTRGLVPEWLRRIARPQHVDNVELDEVRDFGVTINYRGRGRVLTRPALEADLAEDSILALDEPTHDTYWNAQAYWANVPPAVWEFQIGGFPVLRKWLEDRNQAKLGRRLTLGEVRYFSAMARRLAALVALGPELNECHELVVAAALVLDETVTDPSLET